MKMVPKMTFHDWLGIIFLTLVCAVISFARLGDRTAPQTSWSPAMGEYAIIDLGARTELSGMQFRIGARHRQGFVLHHSHDGEDWLILHTHIPHPNELDVFSWSQVPLSGETRFIRITATGHELRLHEIAFRGAEGELITNITPSPGAEALTDEQHTVPEHRTFMNSAYFDEFYHPRAAYEYVHGLRVFETTHPPMGKNFIALSVRIFGMTPWAWRLPGTLFGVLMVPLLYAFARALFASNRWALFAAAIFSFDFMRFVQTRLATIDTYVTFFVLAMYFFMYLYVREINNYAATKKTYEGNLLRRTLPLLAICGVMMGFAIASKWQGVYGAIGLPILFFPALYKLYTTERRYEKNMTRITFLSCFGFFVAVPLLIYALSYIPFVLAQGEGWRGAWDNQQHMFSYHAHLVAEHNFASNWWSWPLMVRPLWLYVNRISPEVNAGMSTLGNPAVWWFGLVATGAAVAYAVRRIKTLWATPPYPRKLMRLLDPNIPVHGARWEVYIVIFLLLAYAMQFLPWAFVTRLTFIYHYFPSVPFVVLLITWFFRRYVKYRAITIGYAALVVALFAFFYPVLSGWPMNVDFVHTWHTWFSGWVFM